MTGVPAVRRIWALVRADAAGLSHLELTASEPSAKDVASAQGVLLLTGMLADDGAQLSVPIVSAIPARPRYDLFVGVSGTDGVAAIAFDPPFAGVPKAVAMATPNTLAGPLKAEIVAGSLGAAGCKVRVTTTALVTGAVSALAGASVTVIAIGG